MLHGMLVIGENLNATRKLRVGGPRFVSMEDGRTAIRYETPDRKVRFLDVTDALESEAVKKNNLVPHIAVAIRQGNAEYVQTMALAQKRAGADFLDLCVDEVSPNPQERHEHARWLVRTVQEAVAMPLSIDSSDAGCINAALEVYDYDRNGPPMINSVNLEPTRLPLLEIAAGRESRLIANASGEAGIPAGPAERLENLTRLMALMDQHRIPLESRFLDPLVLPIATDGSNGKHFLETVRRARERFPGVHITGGFSNVSFGLPLRRLLNDAMTYLAREAGADTAFIDPIQSRDFQPEEEGFRKAMAALLGEDEYCAAFIAYAKQ